jgi:hypothetical protein
MPWPGRPGLFRLRWHVRLCRRGLAAGVREEDLVQAGLAEREVAHPDSGAGELAECVRGELAGGPGVLLCREAGGDDGRVGFVADGDLVAGDQVAGAVPVRRVQQPDPDAGAAPQSSSDRRGCGAPAI